MLFYWLARLRVADSEQLFHLADAHGHPVGAVQHRRRLKQLFEWGYIDLPPEQRSLWRPGKGSMKNVYALGQQGADTLSRAMAQDRRFGVDVQALGGKWTTKNREIRADTLAHLLSISRFFTALTRACAGSRVSIAWRSEWEWPPAREERQRVTEDAIYLDTTRDLVRTTLYPADAPRDLDGQRPSKKLEIPIRPDAFFELSWQGRGGQGEHASFFLEADRATEPVAGRRRSLLKRSLFRKYVGYWNWATNERGHKAYGLSGFSVLTVTTSHQRAANFSAAAAAAVSRRPPRAPLFWATAETDFLATEDDPSRFSNLASPIWISEKGEPGLHHPFEHVPF